MTYIFSRMLMRWSSRITLMVLLVSPVFAQQSPLVAAIEDYLRVQTQGLPGKVSFTISPLDAQTRLAPCSAFEPFVPPGRQLWGRTNLGVRCLGPGNWTVYVPVQLSVVGNYLVSARQLPGGSVLTSADIAVRHGDLCNLPVSVLTDVAQATGKTLKSTLAAAQPLRGDQLIAPWAVQQGQNVKTISSGAGFSVSSDGKALNNAAEGQVVQVRTNTGQTVSGIARPGGIVEISH